MQKNLPTKMDEHYSYIKYNYKLVYSYIKAKYILKDLKHTSVSEAISYALEWDYLMEKSNDHFKSLMFLLSPHTNDTILKKIGSELYYLLLPDYFSDESCWNNAYLNWCNDVEKQYIRLKNYTNKELNFLADNFFLVSEYESGGSKKKSYNKFMEKYEPENSQSMEKEINKWTCLDCETLLLYDDIQGEMVCPECGKVFDSTKFNEDYNYHDIVNHGIEMNVKVPYKRTSHFQECLDQFHAIVYNEVDPSIMKLVKDKIKIDRKSISNINHAYIQKIFKQLGYSQYYKFSYVILKELGAPLPPPISSDVQAQIMRMFSKIQHPFEIYKSQFDRKSFIGYKYVLYKLCELLGLTEQLKYIQLPKHRQNTQQLDAMWKMICKHLNWKYINTV